MLETDFQFGEVSLSTLKVYTISYIFRRANFLQCTNRDWIREIEIWRHDCYFVCVRKWACQGYRSQRKWRWFACVPSIFSRYSWVFLVFLFPSFVSESQVPSELGRLDSLSLDQPAIPPRLLYNGYKAQTLPNNNAYDVQPLRHWSLYISPAWSSRHTFRVSFHHFLIFFLYLMFSHAQRT